MHVGQKASISLEAKLVRRRKVYTVQKGRAGTEYKPARRCTLDGKICQARDICQLEENTKHTASRRYTEYMFWKDIGLETYVAKML
jgi:hypothetical protein